MRSPTDCRIRSLLAVSFLLFAACGQAERAAVVSPTARGYILISIDTLRADHLGAYGYSRPTSPFLDSLAARGVLFENAIVQLPGTLPSHMSIFTGLYPGEHGVYPPDKILSTEIETLPETFRRAGFVTAGFTEGGYMDGHYGFSRGFDRFSDEAAKMPRDIETTLARGLQFLDGLGPSDRFFLFLHTYAVHDPYDPPEPYRSMFWPAESPPGAFAPTGPNLAAVNAGQRPVTAEQVKYFKALYDGGIRYMDHVLEGWFRQLDERGFLDRTMIVVTSDHGEEFLEHGKLVHEQIYHENLHVPLLLIHPGLPAGVRVSRLVESIDLAPTLHQLAGIEPPRRLSGRSLVDVIFDAPTDDKPEAYAESFDVSDRALYVQQENDLYHLLVFAPTAEAGAAWIERSVTFDSYGSQLAFSALSFHQPRRLRIEVDGQPHSEVDAQPNWQRFEVELPGSKEKHRVTIAADGCVSPFEVGLNADRRCLSFRLRDVSLHRTELYRPLHDPLEQHDLSADHGSLSRRLTRRLQQYRFEPRAEAGVEGLSDELHERLKSLGYLQ